MKKLLIIQIIILFNFIGCVKQDVDCIKQEDECLPVTIDFLQGEWVDCENETYDLGGRTFNFQFMEQDSFYLHKNLYTDQLFIECGFNIEWDIYAKGSIFQNNSKIIIDGYYCNENYEKLIYSPCIHYVDTGKFYMEFDIFSFCNDTLILQNTNLSDWESLIKLKRK